LRGGYDSPRRNDVQVSAPTSFLRASVRQIEKEGVGKRYAGRGGFPGVSAILRETEERRGISSSSSSSSTSSSSIPHVAYVMQALRRQEAEIGRGEKSPLLYHHQQQERNAFLLQRHRNEFGHLKRSRGREEEEGKKEEEEKEWGSNTHHHHSQHHPSFNNHNHNHTPPLSMERSSTPLSEEERGGGHKKPKTSRYLREVDRRAILIRIEQGEKQSVLAKEYDVSRAAICNLYKHREEVLSRTDQNPLAKHPKKPRPKRFFSENSSSLTTTIDNTSANASASASGDGGGQQNISSSSASSFSSSSSSTSILHEVKTQAMNLLVTSMLNQRTCLKQAFKSCLRAMRLLMEETLALVQLKSVEFTTVMGETYEGIQMASTPIFLSMENQYSSPITKVFQEIHETTTIPTPMMGYCKPPTESHTTSYMIMWDTPTLQQQDNKTPFFASLKGLSVILFQLVTSTNGQDLCQMIQYLLTQGASQEMMYIVIMFTCSEAVSSVHLKFPQVKVITARMDPIFSRGQKNIRNHFTSFTSFSSPLPSTFSSLVDKSEIKEEKKRGKEEDRVQLN
jgi:uracil phosphoribosyltransferase